MTQNSFTALVNKYATLLFVGYALSFTVSILASYILPKYYSISSDLIVTLSSSAWVIQLIVNIVAAVLVSKDLTKYKIKNDLVVAFTVFFSLIGVTFFFILANREIKDANV